MKDLFRYLEVPFDDQDIAIERLIAFSSDHLERLVLNNPGAQFNQRITATTAALTTVETCTNNDLTKFGVRKACKQGKNAFRTALPGNIAKLHGAVVAKFGAESQVVSECFPHGRTIYSNCKDNMVDNHLHMLIDGLTAHQADLGPQPLADAGGLLSTWTALYAASKSSSAAKASTEESRRNARLNLQLELFKNLLAIAAVYARQPEKISLFMQQSLLEDHPHAEKKDEENAA